MGKNNALINTYRTLDRKIKELTPNIYASFALALHRYHDWTTDEVAELFGEVHGIWSEGVNESHNLLEECEEEVDIIIQIEVFGKDEV